MKLARRVLLIFFRIEAAIAVTAFTAVASLLLADVLLRELFSSSIPGAQRVSVYMMICAGFLGLSIAAARGRHLRPTFADGLTAKFNRKTIERIGSIIMTAVFFSFAVIAVGFVQESYEYGDLARVIDIPLWILQLVVPYAFFSTGLRYGLYGLYPDLMPAGEQNL